MKVIDSLDLEFCIMFIIANFAPLYEFGDGWVVKVYSTYGFGYPGILFILISIILIFRFSVSRVFLYRGLYISFLGGITVLGLIVIFS